MVKADFSTLLLFIIIGLSLISSYGYSQTFITSTKKEAVMLVYFIASCVISISLTLITLIYIQPNTNKIIPGIK